MHLFVIGPNGQRELNGKCRFAPHRLPTNGSDGVTGHSDDGMQKQVIEAFDGEKCTADDTLLLCAYSRDDQLFKRGDQYLWRMEGIDAKDTQRLLGRLHLFIICYNQCLALLRLVRCIHKIVFFRTWKVFGK